MIRIAGTSIHPSSLFSEQQWNDLQKEMIGKLADDPIIHAYDSRAEFQFELTLRHYIVDAAEALNASGVAFASFQNSRCNERYWRLTDYGGFHIREGVTPADGIRDIFRSGPKYAFECATAMVIVYYRAVLEVLGAQSFNRLFADMLLYDWQYDKDLGLQTVTGTVQIPGDVVYFKNPDYNRDTPEWQGENAIVMGSNMYYGHGIGITGARQIISVLNRFRTPGSAQSAFLVDSVTRPDFHYLSRFRQMNFRGISPLGRLSPHSIHGWIGSTYHEM